MTANTGTYSSTNTTQHKQHRPRPNTSPNEEHCPRPISRPEGEINSRAMHMVTPTITRRATTEQARAAACNVTKSPVVVFARVGIAREEHVQRCARGRCVTIKAPVLTNSTKPQDTRQRTRSYIAPEAYASTDTKRPNHNGSTAHIHTARD